MTGTNSNFFLTEAIKTLSECTIWNTKCFFIYLYKHNCIESSLIINRYTYTYNNNFVQNTHCTPYHNICVNSCVYAFYTICVFNKIWSIWIDQTVVLQYSIDIIWKQIMFSSEVAKHLVVNIDAMFVVHLDLKSARAIFYYTVIFSKFKPKMLYYTVFW